MIDFFPEWAPIGVAHFKKVAEAGVYNEACIFRVIPNFVIQFGIAGDPALDSRWAEKKIQDEPVKTSNKKGTVSFAKSRQPNTRSTQLFVNLGDNAKLDGMGFSPNSAGTSRSMVTSPASTCSTRNRWPSCASD